MKFREFKDGLFVLVRHDPSPLLFKEVSGRVTRRVITDSDVHIDPVFTGEVHINPDAQVQEIAYGTGC